jgi:hypothetical protein
VQEEHGFTMKPSEFGLVVTPRQRKTKTASKSRSKL